MKKPLAAFIFLFTLILSSSYVLAAKPISTPSLKNQIDKLLNEFGENINIGIVVLNPKTGKIIYEKNADRYFSPASSQKLFTAFAALNYLNANFAYRTNLFLDTTKIQNGILNDNLYLQFSGDPTLTFEQLDRLISRLAQAGVQRINGNIIVDDTAFDYITMSPGTSWDDRNFCFGSPISALIINHNCINATITPAQSPDQPAILTLPEQPQFMHLINNTMTRSANADCRLEAKIINENTYAITGCMKITEPTKNLSLAIYNPRINVQAALIHLLDKYRIANNRVIEFRKIDAAYKAYASANSKPLPALVTAMLKDSDNTIANSLFKTIGGLYAGTSGTWENGQDALRNILTKTLRLDIPDAKLVDGAGSSRYDFVTPLHIAALLYKIYLSKDAGFFLSALPISGTDGTLKFRMHAKEIQGKVHAKTGSETAITSLSGFLETDQKHTLIFSIIINGFVDSPRKYKELEDKICTTLIKSG